MPVTFGVEQELLVVGSRGRPIAAGDEVETATDDDRYLRMSQEFGLLSRQQLTCGQHVHVQIGSRDEGAGVIEPLSGWLPSCWRCRRTRRSGRARTPAMPAFAR